MWYIAKPDHILPLSAVHSASHLMTYCKQHNLKKIAYGFIHMSPTSHTLRYLKFGRSSKSTGERVYRQAGHIPGWNNLLKGPSGSDMKEIIADYEKEYPDECVHKDDITLCIWDVTNVPNPNAFDDAYNTRLCENSLLDEHEKLFGCLPVGNPKDTRNEKMGGFVIQQVFSNLFDEID